MVEIYRFIMFQLLIVIVEVVVVVCTNTQHLAKDLDNDNCFKPDL